MYREEVSLPYKKWDQMCEEEKGANVSILEEVTIKNQRTRGQENRYDLASAVAARTADSRSKWMKGVRGEMSGSNVEAVSMLVLRESCSFSTDPPPLLLGRETAFSMSLSSSDEPSETGPIESSLGRTDLTSCVV